ncbi:MAG TPA: DMT family transporter [Candidatus Saccharimonadales bacterium]|nr:DMT family transporter [Candidatus Saccharimonadales bacterium]
MNRMIAIVIIITLLASLSNAVSGVLERKATGTPNASDLFSPHFITALLRQKLWLIGESFNILGFLLQAIALKFGALSVVQPLMTTNLLFLLLILYWRFKVPMTRREWIGGAAICVGLSALLAIANPRGGHADFNGGAWLIVSCIVAVFIVISALFVRRLPHPVWRAAVAGTAAGMNFALTAAFTKLVVDQLQYGVLGVVTGWELYALMASGVASLITLQSTYGAGPLAISTPAMQIFDPLLGIIIGVVIFGDIINIGTIDLVAEAVCGLVMTGGIILLAGSKRIQQYSDL